MDRQLRSTLIVITVIGFLGLGAAAEQIRERLMQAKPLAPFSGNLHAIQLESPGLPTRRLEHSLGAWQLVQPFAAPADSATVQALIGVARAPSRLRYPESEFDLGQIGLRPPFAALTLDDNRLEFGALDAIHQERYVRIGHEIVLVPDRYSVALVTPAEQLIDPHPFAAIARIAGASVDGIALSAAATVSLPSLVARKISARPENFAGYSLLLVDGSDRSHQFTLAWSGEALLVSPQAAPIVYQIESAPPALHQALATIPPAALRDGSSPAPN